MSAITSASPAKAQTIVVTTMLVAGVLVVIRSADSGTKPTARQVLGIGVSGVGLSFAAQFAPRLAAAFSLLWLTSEVMLYGGPAFDAITKATSKNTGTTKSSKPAAKTAGV